MEEDKIDWTKIAFGDSHPKLPPKKPQPKLFDKTKFEDLDELHAILNADGIYNLILFEIAARLNKKSLNEVHKIIYDLYGAQLEARQTLEDIKNLGIDIGDEEDDDHDHY